MSTDRDQNVTLLNLREQVIAGRFRFLRPLRRGSYAQIWVADNMAPTAGEPPIVAVKILNLESHSQVDPQLQALLADNIKLEDYSLRRLEHPHIVKLYESGETADRRTGRRFYYLVLELLEGGDVSELCRGNPLKLVDALHYIGQVCSALTCAHENGIIHRDIKPNNLLLTKDGNVVKALDFGTASLLDKQNGEITRVGTEVYAAPESYSPASRLAVTRAADVYSLAKVLLFMLTGESPAFAAQKQITFLPATLIAEPWADSVFAVLSKSTSDDPRNRYQSVEEFDRALRQVLEFTEVSAGVRSHAVRTAGDYFQPPKITRFEVPVVNITSAAVAALPRNMVKSNAPASRISQSIRDGAKNTPNSLLLQILAVVIIGLLVIIVARVIPSSRHSNLPVVSPQSFVDPLVGKEGRTSTDVNIRSGSGAEQQKIGLLEKDSRVRILSCSADRTWYEVQVLKHGRPKTDPNSLDHGWVRSKFIMSAN